MSILNYQHFELHHHQHQHQQQQQEPQSIEVASEKKKYTRVSLDNGYESMLSTVSFLSNSTSADANSSCSIGCDSSNTSSVHLFSQPSTPVKSNASSAFIFNGNNSTTTPDFKQQYVADVSGMYLASIRSASKLTTATTTSAATTAIHTHCINSNSESSSSSCSFQSPMKSNTSKSFGFCSFTPSCSADSPRRLINSPKFLVPSEEFVNERDTFRSKLLRSPAFKPHLNNHPYSKSSEQAARPVVKSFSARLQASQLGGSCGGGGGGESGATAQFPSAPPTPTQEEFMELLFKNRHIPKNPEFLIGRHMGLETLDIIGELHRRSMHNVLDLVCAYVASPVDLVRMAGVSTEWRQVVKENKRANAKRSRFIRLKRSTFESTKENRMSDGTRVRFAPELAALAEEKRQLFKSSRAKTTLGGGDGTNGCISFVFTSLDVNWLQNQPHHSQMSPPVAAAAATAAAATAANSNATALGAGIAAAASGDFDPIAQLNSNFREISRIFSKAAESMELRGNLVGAAQKSSASVPHDMEKRMQRVSIQCNEVASPGVVRTASVLSKASSIDVSVTIPLKPSVDVSPALICKKLQVKTPTKKTDQMMRIDSPTKLFSKTDLICSKKSRKNLKRL